MNAGTSKPIFKNKLGSTLICMDVGTKIKI